MESHNQNNLLQRKLQARWFHGLILSNIWGINDTNPSQTEMGEHFPSYFMRQELSWFQYWTKALQEKIL